MGFRAALTLPPPSDYSTASFASSIVSRRGLRWRKLRASGIETTAVEKHLKSQELREAYERLPLADRYRLIDLLFEPNGYTLLGFLEGGAGLFGSESRVAANTLRIAELHD
jgi:hypothetical protein